SGGLDPCSDRGNGSLGCSSRSPCPPRGGHSTRVRGPPRGRGSHKAQDNLSPLQEEEGMMRMPRAPCSLCS
ncbi:unnamed protein product, partial [Rangifer tarandus platyrhynchus]